MRRLFSFFLAATLTASALFSASCVGKTRYRETVYGLFDTVITLTGYAWNESEFETACTLVFGVLEKYHDLTDIYQESENEVNLATVNACAGTAPVTVGEELYAFLLFARGVAQETDGACDLTLGTVTQLWKRAEEDTAAGNPRVPSAPEIAAALSHTGWEKLSLSDGERSVFFADPSMLLDVGATAKGYAVEKAMEALTDAGYTGYLLDAGGNLCGVGEKPEGSFLVGIRSPSSLNEVLVTLPLVDEALVTAGSYLRYFTVGDREYHHIISPETGMPSEAFLSVSVKAESSALADGYATAMFAMDREWAHSFLSRHPEVEAYFVYCDGSAFRTDGFA